MDMRRDRQRHPRLNATSAYYSVDRFLVVLECDPPFIRRDETVDIRQMHLFAHEFWHYLHDVSTVAGFKSFSISQQRLVAFSQTLQRRADGTSEGSAPGSDLKAIWKIRSMLTGDECPPDWGDEHPLYWNDGDSQICALNASIGEDCASLGGKDAPAHYGLAALKVRGGDGVVRDGAMVIGTLAISESVAYIVEEAVRLTLPDIDPDPPPPVPYQLVGHLVTESCGRQVEPYFAAALGTLALLDAHPGRFLVDASRHFGDLVRSGKSSASALRDVIEASRASRDATIERILSDDLPMSVRAHAGRGLNEPALVRYSKMLESGLRRRQSNPLYDIDLVFPVLDSDAIVDMMRSECLVIQRYSGADDQPERDVLYFSKTRRDADGFRESDYIGALHAQQHYVHSHLGSDEASFVDSSLVNGRCPFYETCSLPDRKAMAPVCAERPWGMYSPREDGCLYSMAVAATMGTVKISRAD